MPRVDARDPVAVEHRETREAGIRHRQEVFGPAGHGDDVGDRLGDRKGRGRAEVVDLDGEDPLAAGVEAGQPEAPGQLDAGRRPDGGAGIGDRRLPGGCRVEVVAQHEVADPGAAQHVDRPADVAPGLQALLHRVEHPDRAGGGERHGIPHGVVGARQRADRLVDGAGPLILAEARGRHTSARPSSARAESQAPACFHWRAMSETCPAARSRGEPRRHGHNDDQRDRSPGGHLHGEAVSGEGAHEAVEGVGSATASGSRTSGSALWMLRNATSGPSRRAWAVGASGDDTGPVWATASANTPTASVARRKRRSGSPRRASTESAAPATSEVVTMSSGPVATAYPPATTRRPRSPRLEPVRRAACDVEQVDLADESALRSIQSRNGGEHRPSTTSGPSHQALAAGVAAVHHHVVGELHHRRRVSSQMPAGTAARIVAVAFTPPQQSTAMPDSAAARRGPMRPWVASTTGSRMAGARSRAVPPRKGRRWSTHPRAEGVGERTEHPGRGAADPQGGQQSVGREQADGEQQAPPEPLGHPDRHDLPDQPEERPHREEVAVALVLQDAPGDLRVPQVGGPRQQPPRRHVEVVLGVLGDAPGRHRPGHRPHQHQGRREPWPDPADGVGHRHP